MKKQSLQITFLKQAGLLRNVIEGSLAGRAVGAIKSRFQDRKKWYIPKFMKKNRAKAMAHKWSGAGSLAGVFGLTPSNLIGAGSDKIKSLLKQHKHNSNLSEILKQNKIKYH